MDHNKSFKNLLAYWTVKDKKPVTNNDSKTKSHDGNNNPIPLTSTIPTNNYTTLVTPPNEPIPNTNYSAPGSNYLVPDNSYTVNEGVINNTNSNNYNDFFENSSSNNNNIISSDDGYEISKSEDSFSVYAKSYSTSSAYTVMDDDNDSQVSYSTQSYNSFNNLNNDSSYVVGETSSYSTIQSDNTSPSSTYVESNFETIKDDNIDDGKKKPNEGLNSNEKVNKKYMAETRHKKSVGRDWNKEFQELLRVPPSLNKFQKLSFLALDFVKAAENYGFIIIKEMFMPVELKTIKPINIGGIAGGQKFICQNILFKFAYDQEIAEGHYLYGGKYPFDLGASKAAGNELKGLSNFFQHSLDNELGNLINVPLMCIIDYYGYRLIAMSVLPITKSTLIYGSSDGGNKVHKDIKEVNDMMEVLGKSMNLKGHLSGINPEFVYGPGDLEIHKSIIDSRYYSVDYGRLFPPEAHFDKENKPIAHREVFYKLLRPELLKKLNRSLSSDAFTGWANSDPECDQLNQEVGDATLELYSKVIPEAVNQFESEFKRLGNYPEVKKTFDISIEAHKFGINLRHLGRVRELIKDQELRSIVLNEMVARVLKNKIKDIQRIQLTGHYVGSEEKCIQTICEFLNLIFGIYKYDSDQKDFWTILIKTMCMDKYGNENSGLSAQELDHKYDLLKALNLSIVLSKFQLKTGIKLGSRIKKILSDPNKVIYRLPMVLPSDIKDVRPVIKHSNMIARSEGISLYMNATELIYKNHVSFGKPPPVPDYNRFRDDFSEELSLLELCSSKLKLAARSNTTDASLYHLLGLVEFERFKLANVIPHSSPHLQNAKEMFQTSIKFHSTSSSILSLGTVYDVYGHIKESIPVYRDQLLKLFPLEQVIPLLYESASFYSPTYGPVLNTNLTCSSFHQLLVIIDLLKTLPKDHKLVLEYLNNSYYLLSILLIKVSANNDFQFTSKIVSIYSIRSSTNHTAADSDTIFSSLIEESLLYNNHLLDEFINFAFKIDKLYNIASSLILHCKTSPSLTKVVKEFLLSNRGILSQKDVYSSLLTRSNDTMQHIINHLNIPIEYYILHNTNIDISIQEELKCLCLSNFTFNDEFLSKSKIYGPRITTLILDRVNILEENCSIYNQKMFQLPNIKTLVIKNIECPIEFIESFFGSIKSSLEILKVNSIYFYPIDEEGEANLLKINQWISEFGKLKKLRLDNFQLKPEFYPLSLESITLNIGYSNEAQDSISMITQRCKQLKSFSSNEIFNYSSLKSVGIKSLKLVSNSGDLDYSKIDSDNDLWSKSLEHGRFTIPRSYGNFNQFISNLQNLSSLILYFYNLNDGNMNVLLDNLKNLKNLKLFDCTNYKLISNESTIISKSIETLSMFTLSAPTDNYKNIGMIYPNLRSLELEGPRSFSDVTMLNLIENIESPLKSLSLKDCFDITDTSIISLVQSKSNQSLESISIYNSSKILDGAYVKLVDSCPNIKSIRISTNFKRNATLLYLRFKYPKLEILTR